MILQYVRDKKRRRVGVVVALSPTQIGWSRYSKKEKRKFDPEEALAIAKGRALKTLKRDITNPSRTYQYTEAEKIEMRKKGFNPPARPPRDVLATIEEVKERAKAYFRQEIK